MRLIDIDDISLRKTIACGGLSAKALWRRIQQQPTIDAVEVVRCRECIYGKIREVDDKVQVYCDYQFDWWNADGYCNYGERKDERSRR